MGLKEELQVQWNYHKNHQPTIEERTETFLEYIANCLRKSYERCHRNYVKVELWYNQEEGIYNITMDENIDENLDVLNLSARTSKDEWEIECDVNFIDEENQLYTFFVVLD